MQVKVDLGDPYGVIEVMINTPSTYPFEPPTMTIRSKIVIGKLANWLKGSGSAQLCLRPLVLITGKHNWGDGI